jgi:hypothetical protein
MSSARSRRESGLDRRHLFPGRRTTLNSNLAADLQQNSRAGATLAYPVVNNAIKLYASKGLSARTGNSYVLVGAAWRYRWEAGQRPEPQCAR